MFDINIFQNITNIVLSVGFCFFAVINIKLTITVKELKKNIEVVQVENMKCNDSAAQIDMLKQHVVMLEEKMSQTLSII